MGVLFASLLALAPMPATLEEACVELAQKVELATATDDPARVQQLKLWGQQRLLRTYGSDDCGRRP